MIPAMQHRFDTAISRIAFPDGRHPSFLLGVSGGVDSMTMLHLFLSCASVSSVAVAHVNFSLRGGESDGDEALVRDFCARRGIPFRSCRVDTAAVASEEGISIEMAARKIRYDWFESLLDEMHLDYVAVAHNLNDSVETLFLNLLRGTGIKGVCGIRPLNGRVFRPMLDFTRAEIDAFARENSVPFRVDSSNMESEYARNRIRNEVFPQFSKINPSFLSTVRSSMEHFAGAYDIVAQDMERCRKEICSSADGVTVIDIDALKAAGNVEFRLFMLLDGFGFNSSQAGSIAASLDGGSGAVFRSPSHVLVRDRGCLRVYPAKVPEVTGCNVRIFERTPDFDPKKAPAGVLYADADLLVMPLHCRRWRNADSFRPLGMKRFRKVSDFFTDLKLDVEMKKRQTIVTTGDGSGRQHIVCILGVRLDDRFRVSDSTVRIAEIS